MKTQVILIIVVVAVILGAIVIAASQGIYKTTTQPQQTATQVSAKTIEVSGEPFKFTPGEIKVKKGEKVKIVFTNTQGFHDFVLTGYNLNTKQIQANQTDSIEFTADKVGTFEFYCSVPTHKDKGMVGKLIVE